MRRFFEVLFEKIGAWSRHKKILVCVLSGVILCAIIVLVISLQPDDMAFIPSSQSSLPSTSSQSSSQNVLKPPSSQSGDDQIQNVSKKHGDYKKRLEDASGKEFLNFFFDGDLLGSLPENAVDVFALLGTIERDIVLTDIELWYIDDSTQKRVVAEKGFYPQVYYHERGIIIISSSEEDGQMLYRFNRSDLSAILLRSFDDPSTVDYTSDGALVCKVYNNNFGTSAGSWTYYSLDFDGASLFEYGAKSVSTGDVKRLGNGEELLRRLSDTGYIVDGLLYRSNDMLVVNCHMVGGVDRAIYLKIDGGNLFLMNEEHVGEYTYIYGSRYDESAELFFGENHCKPALFPDIAVYPSHFPY